MSKQPEQRWHLFPDEEPPLDVPVVVEHDNGRCTLACRVYVDDADFPGLCWATIEMPERWPRDNAWTTGGADRDDFDIVAWHPLPERRKA